MTRSRIKKIVADPESKECIEDSEEGEGDGMEVGGENVEERRTFTMVGARKRKKNNKEVTTGSSGESGEEEVIERRREELKLMIRFREGHGMIGVSPIALTTELKKLIGEIKSAKVMQDGALLMICVNGEQRIKAMRIKKVCKQEVVSCKPVGERTGVSGVISGVPIEVSVEEIKKNLEGGKVGEVRRLQMNRDGSRVDSLSVMLKFEEEVLPERVRIGYISFPVRAYVKAPMRCYNCQRYGHIAKVCKAKKRCARCGGEHDYGRCEEDAEVKCCNCGGAHSVAYGGCAVRKKAVEVQKEKDKTNLSYAEAVKLVERRSKEKVEEGNKRGQNVSEARVQIREEGVREVREDVLGVSKKNFVLFMAEVINCTAQTEKRTEKIQIIVKAAERFLGVKGLTWEKVRDGLTLESQQSQETWVGH